MVHIVLLMVDFMEGLYHLMGDLVRVGNAFVMLDGSWGLDEFVEFGICGFDGLGDC